MMDSDDFFEEFKVFVSSICVWKVSERGIAPSQWLLVVSKFVKPEITYGQDTIDTSRIPIIIALFTLYDIRMTVSRPPRKTPIHNFEVS